MIRSNFSSLVSNVPFRSLKRITYWTFKTLAIYHPICGQANQKDANDGTNVVHGIRIHRYRKREAEENSRHKNENRSDDVAKVAIAAELERR